MTTPARSLGRPETRRRTRFVKSLAELADGEAFLANAVEEVSRRRCPGAPKERMLKVTMHSEQEAAKIQETIRELGKESTGGGSPGELVQRLIEELTRRGIVSVDAGSMQA